MKARSVPEMRVALCASSYGGLKAPLARDFLELGLTLGALPGSKYLPILVPRLHGPICLNAAITMSLEAISAVQVREPFTHFLWLDRETILTGEQAIRLLGAVDPWHPAVFALARDPHGDEWQLWDYPDGKRMNTWPADTLVRAHSAGLAAAAFDGELFDSLKKPWFSNEKPKSGHDALSNVCLHFHIQGIPVYCHTGIVVKQVFAPPVYGPEGQVQV